MPLSETRQDTAIETRDVVRQADLRGTGEIVAVEVLFVDDERRARARIPHTEPPAALLDRAAGSGAINGDTAKHEAIHGLRPELISFGIDLLACHSRCIDGPKLVPLRVRARASPRQLHLRLEPFSNVILQERRI